MSFARWGWGPDLSGEPWMNQPDHSRPICGEGAHQFFLQLPLPMLLFLSFLSPRLGLRSGRGSRAVAEGTALESVVKLRPSAGPANFTFKTPHPEMGSHPGPGRMPRALCRGQDRTGPGPWAHLPWRVPPATSVRLGGLVHSSCVQQGHVLCSAGLKVNVKTNPPQNYH